MMKTYTKADIGVSLTQAKLVELTNDTVNGSFCVITGYTKSGDEKDSPLEKGSIEVANFVLNFGINYGRAKDASIAMLNDWLMGKIPALESFKVARGIWTDGKAEFDRKAKGRVHSKVTKTYYWTDKIVQIAIAEVLSGLIAPTMVPADYQKEGKSVYSLNENLYLRDVRLVQKTVTVKGQYKPTAQGELPAIKDYIRSQLPVGSYRTFKLDDHIEGTISFGGNKLLFENGIVLETTPELVKQYLPELTFDGQIKVAEAVA